MDASDWTRISCAHLCRNGKRARVESGAARVFCIQTLNRRALTTFRETFSFRTGLRFVCSNLKSIYSEQELAYCPQCQASIT